MQCTAEVKKMNELEQNYVKKKIVFYLSVKDLVNRWKNSLGYGTYIGPVNLLVIFPLKKFLCNTRNYCCINGTQATIYENRKWSHLSYEYTYDP